jgi:hypothetical protein
MKITKQNILQAIKEVEKAEREGGHCHHCDVCFVNYLLRIATFDKSECIGCMKVLNEVNKVFGTTYHIYDPFCEYGDAVPYEPIYKKFRRVIPI